MIRKNAKWFVIIIMLAFAIPFFMRACIVDPPPPPSIEKQLPDIAIPSFNADSAYNITDKIVGMSPRVVGSEGARKVKAYLIEQFKKSLFPRSHWPLIKVFTRPTANFAQVVWVYADAVGCQWRRHLIGRTLC